MIDPIFMIAATCVVGISVVAFALLRAWQGWLDLKREELDRPHTTHHHASAPEIEGGAGVGAARIEVADLKERIKKLEAIASGVEL
ncbi:hypothetical protein [Erythrobacter sp. F6033]|uniref:hypothetical protein n=1 Tax=Erythrobacter sp. F6033 TaxID=2926401 RepID=UPI001FF4259A|nr:hypothetical protein [Erythrobacter sp. F6033]MCK0127725.1 hypothetical protein [Erythrobacter sp. F6033]